MTEKQLVQANNILDRIKKLREMEYELGLNPSTLGFSEVYFQNRGAYPVYHINLSRSSTDDDRDNALILNAAIEAMKDKASQLLLSAEKELEELKIGIQYS